MGMTMEEVIKSRIKLHKGTVEIGNRVIRDNIYNHAKVQETINNIKKSKFIVKELEKLLILHSNSNI